MLGNPLSLCKSVEWDNKLSYVSLVGCVLVIAFRIFGIAVDELVGDALQFRQALRWCREKRKVKSLPQWRGIWLENLH